MRIYRVFNFLVLGLLLLSCQPKKDIESSIMDCKYQSYSDGGLQYIQMLYDYQRYLLDVGLLSDETGESYYQLLEDFRDRKISSDSLSKFICLEINKIEGQNVDSYSFCITKLTLSLLNKDVSKVNRIEEIFYSGKRPHEMAESMLSELSNSDLEKDYYKLVVYTLFCIIDTDAGMD